MGTIFDVVQKEKEILSFHQMTLRDDFWKEPEKASEILKKKNQLTVLVESWKKQHEAVEDLQALHELAVHDNDDQTLSEIGQDLEKLKSAFRREELRMMLSTEEDALNAIISIHAGAGGKEAQDWAEMLLRMYLRWAEKKGFKTTIIDYLPGDEAGVKSVSMTVEGEFVYGFAKAEVGIHRLVRISPFDAGARRHTSFASVFVYPEVSNEIVVEIDEKDLRIDTFRSSGKGGQHVNKTDSAIRITHIPTGIVVQCQNERSQHKNKAMAMKFLRSRIYEMKLREQCDKRAEVNKTKKEIAWGSQIRSYILHPYKMVKDHRTNLEVGNASRVLDGEIDDFIEAYLLH